MRNYFTSPLIVTLKAGAQAERIMMVPVAGGTFLMAPLCTVTVSSFRMSKYEVTYDLWQEVRTWAINNGYDFPVGAKGNGNAANTGNHPVGQVGWIDAVKWCNALSEMSGLTPCYYTHKEKIVVFKTGEQSLMNEFVNWNANGYRLPTDAEWAYAATNKGSRPSNHYSGSTDIHSVGWYSGNSGMTTHPVGFKAANELGLFDMSGNLSEWVWDVYCDAFELGSFLDPVGHDFYSDYSNKFETRGLRGGAFNDPEANCRLDWRGEGLTWSGGTDSFGLRVVTRN
jgi:formylglycine-generating enzyme required for sulfatase activity